MLRTAADAASLEVLSFIPEDMAVALAVGLHDCEDEKIVMVFDLGATTFDLAILRAASGVIDVKSRAHDTNLGGSILDQLLADHCM